MPDVPSFFNKNDFFGKLLPGYLMLTFFLGLFRPKLLFSSDPASPALSFDLLSAVVFVIGGPAIGVALQQLHRGLFVLGTLVREAVSNRVHKDPRTLPHAVASVLRALPVEGTQGQESTPIPGPGDWKYSEYVTKYACLRLEANDAKKLELDTVEAYYDFLMSTGVALLILGILGVLDRPAGPFGEWVLLLFPAAGIFYVFGWAERRFAFVPLVALLMRKHRIA